MKLGVENRNKTIAAGVLLVLAVGLLLNWLLGSPSAGTPAPASAAGITTPAVKAKSAKGKAAARSLDPTLRFDWLKNSEDTQYAGNGRNIFQDQAEIPTPIAPAGKKEKVVYTPPPPPPPPPINLKFFGFANKPGETKRIFLSEGEDVFIAHEGDIVDRRYKVLHIAPMSVEIEDVLNNNRQSIPLTQG
jgi:hypothetical protein